MVKVTCFCRSVYVRVRPLNDAERERGAAWRVEGNSVFQVHHGLA